MIIKKILKESDVTSEDIDLSKYEHYKYIKSSYDNVRYLFGPPTICLPPPSDIEIEEYCKVEGVIDEAFWIMISECGSEMLLDGYRTIDGSEESSFCLSSDSLEFIKIIKSFVSEDKWCAMDDIRIKTMFPGREK